MRKFQYFKVLFVLCLSINTSVAQQEPYNDEFIFEVISGDQVAVKSKAIKALIVNFDGGNFSNFSKTLRNNPQLKEIQLFNPDQAAIDSLSNIIGNSITHLFIVGGDQNLILPSFPKLELLSIRGDELTNLDMTMADLEVLDILNVESENLISWKTKAEYPKLSLIDLNLPLLKEFPFQSLPALTQLSFHCSLDQIPSFLCNCEMLELMSLENFKVVEVDKCFEKKIKNGFYSNLTIRDGREGEVKLQYLSKDRK